MLVDFVFNPNTWGKPVDIIMIIIMDVKKPALEKMYTNENYTANVKYGRNINL